MDDFMEDSFYQIFSKNDTSKEFTKQEKYLRLKKEKQILSDQSSDILFENIRIGESRGKLENQIKILQAKLKALKGMEEYLDMSAEEIQNRSSKIDSLIAEMERDPEIEKIEDLPSVDSKKEP